MSHSAIPSSAPIAAAASYESAPSLARRERVGALRTACATAHDVNGSGMSEAELVTLILERGLPSREERERILAEKLQGDDTTSA